MLRQQELRRIAKQLRPLVARRDFSLLSLRNVPLVANRISISLNHPEFTTKTYPQFSMKYSTNNGKTFEIKVPEMGESITEATVVEWLKQPGDKVEADETIAVLETDKVSVDVKSPESGVILKHLAKVDATVLVGKPLVELTMQSSAAVAQSPSTKTNKPVETEQEQEEKQEKTKSPIVENQGELMDITIPAMGESIVEGTIVECNKKSGDYVNAGEVIAVLETDKISVDVKSEFSGIVKEVLATQGDVIKVGASLMRVVKGEVPEQKTPVKVEAEKLPPAASEPSKDVSIQNEGSKGSSSAKSTNITKSSESNAVAASESRTFTRTKMNRMRLRIAERLKESQNIAASLTTFQECDMGNLMDLRKSYKDTFEKKHGVKLGFMSAFVKASASALLEFPAINSMIDDDKMEIVQPNYVDISVAVSTGKGLVTPVIKDCEHLSFADIEKTLANLALRARDGKLTMADMTGGNFTISNGGVFGSLMGTPILNRPQSAILGMHATKMRPVLYKNQVVPRPMMYLALTYDHRLVDGREAVLFLKSIADKIEDPQRLMLDL